MSLTIPTSTQILALVAVLTAFQLFSHEIPQWLLAAVCVYACVLFFVKLKEYEDRLDNPEPITYSVEPNVVWSQIDLALRTYMSYCSNNVSVHQDYNDTPAPDAPLLMQYTVAIRHPNLESVRDWLPPDSKDLRSTMVFRAEISEAKGGGTLVKFSWNIRKKIWTRFTENEVIVAISHEIEKLVSKYQMKKG